MSVTKATEVQGRDGRTPTNGYFGDLLRRVFSRFAADAMDDAPQSRDFVLLDVLADGDARSQKDLAERLGINRTVMVRLIDRLEEVGHVSRTRNPANRRSYVLSLTDAGRAALDEMRESMALRNARIAAALTPREQRRLVTLLGRLLPETEQPATQSIEYLITQAHLNQRRTFDALLGDLGLRVRHFGPLTAIDELGPCPQQRLAQHLSITEPAAAEVVDELVQAGMVSRGKDPHDRRRYALELTDRGRELRPSLYEAGERMQSDTREALGADGEEELRSLLGRLLEAQA
ncbi:MAG TPA: transcriptional regulator [Streptomyces sp.]|uniref:MarR family transcriptional regulator n=1 Tax=Streptomyces salyersiae TaxID=3075530 RepID=A0ABU2RP39_9ACTN|nr:MarR family transcriptional regulator [Streptomyces sp. DSM 41770]MDT0430599.1 MarR family transcriptional regulator [Streptomyces sp. DSM 41770]HBF78543.1 transcriptional regulator [Streptomyces sp.]